MPDTVDEFSFLPEQAREAGLDVPLPPGRRRELRLGDGRALSALQWGDGPPRVTLLHGVGLNAHTWDTTVLALGVPALAIDLAGHGDSSWRADADYGPGSLAPDIETALATWTDRPQVLVGHSLGGLTAAIVAAHAPELIARLALVDITPGIDPSAGPAVLREFFAGPTDFASRAELVDRAQAFGMGGTRAQTERGVFFNTRVRADGRVEWKHHFARLAAQPSEGASVLGDRGPLAPHGWSDLAAVRAPITLVRGEHGFVSSDDAATFERHLPAADVVVLDAPHNVQEVAPAALAALIRDRLDR
ncbi:alpha/beta hydrolase [Microbacterium sp. LRZ72]|uniref:alpha/beta fold hydrolase n=1 Tax=Microbacterium sp. LRZ72 TaxID=2942481 RepID=UPI0029A0F776|nr:alpha/beta hydrolase [Microbacterium sp. LRZ72]MDX2378074.1 alpha/beta hydrolase [Microbacterium sp. LRZ72]